jgi:hypothetical protein
VDAEGSRLQYVTAAVFVCACAILLVLSGHRTGDLSSSSSLRSFLFLSVIPLYFHSSEYCNNVVCAILLAVFYMVQLCMIFLQGVVF